MFIFIEPMNTTNKRDRFKLMLFVKIVFNLYCFIIVFDLPALLYR